MTFSGSTTKTNNASIDFLELDPGFLLLATLTTKKAKFLVNLVLQQSLTQIDRHSSEIISIKVWCLKIAFCKTLSSRHKKQILTRSSTRCMLKTVSSDSAQG